MTKDIMKTHLKRKANNEYHQVVLPDTLMRRGITGNLSGA